MLQVTLGSLQKTECKARFVQEQKGAERLRISHPSNFALIDQVGHDLPARPVCISTHWVPSH